MKLCSPNGYVNLQIQALYKPCEINKHYETEKKRKVEKERKRTNNMQNNLQAFLI